MPRKNLIRTDQFPYHIYSRSNNRAFFPLPTNELWEIFTERLYSARKKFSVNIYSFALMSNHYHLLIQTPNADIDKVMHDFSHKLSLEILKRTNSINRIFGGRYKWSLIRGDQHFATVYRYILQNPLRAGLVQKVEQYPYTSLHFSAAQLTPPPLSDCLGNKDLDVWLNETNESACEIEKGLKKTIFKPVHLRSY